VIAVHNTPTAMKASPMPRKLPINAGKTAKNCQKNAGKLPKNCQKIAEKTAEKIKNRQKLPEKIKNKKIKK
jgi:hypothetical protein